MSNDESRKPLLKAVELKKHFDISGKGKLHAVDGISFEMYENETLGLVGESGCGKSTVGNVLLQLLKATDGQIIFEDKDLIRMNKNELHAIRRDIQMIFQDPYSSLNPRKTVRSILSEPLSIYKMEKDKDAINKKVEEMAKTVGLEDYVLDCFPHELDGGKRQMVGIARALILNPKLIVCDEPVSALDVSVQSTILNLLIDMQNKMGLSYLFISHDLSVVRHISNRVAVMYLGQIVEIAETDDLFSNTLHPYTIALLSAVPNIDFENQKQRIVLTGDVPSPMNPKPGCRFAPRCWMACEDCRKNTPELQNIGNGHKVACHYWKESIEKAKNLVNKEA